MMRQCLVKVVNEDLSHLLPGIKAPTLLVWGENDTATPLADAKKMEAAIPEAGLAVIKNAGHFSFVEQPAIFRSIMASFFKIG
jgi:pimeloyl-ACP methyl ester carboxylesterase